MLHIEAPLLITAPNTDPGIEPIAVATDDGQRYVPTSPEHFLKRCLAAGYGDCLAALPVARQVKKGLCDQPTFTMLEWYRVGWDLSRLQNGNYCAL